MFNCSAACPKLTVALVQLKFSEIDEKNLERLSEKFLGSMIDLRALYKVKSCVPHHYIADTSFSAHLCGRAPAGARCCYRRRYGW